MNKGKSDTGITKKLGRIPEGWRIVKFEEIADFFSGGTPSTSKSEFYKGNIPFIKSGEIGKEKTSQFLSDDGLKKSSAKKVKKDDLLYALYGANSGEVAISKIDGAINQAVLCIRSKHDIKFLCEFLKFKKNRIISSFLQGGQGNLSSKIIKKLLLTLPPLPEQQKIAQILSTWDKAIALQDQLIQEKQALKKGLMQQLLTGKKRFAGFEEEWEEVRLSEVFSLSSGKTKPKNFSEHPLDEFAIPVYGGNGISGYTNEVFFNGPVILIGRVGEYCGIIHFVRESIWITYNCMYTKEFNPKNDILFFAFLLEYIQLYRLRNKGGQPLVSQKPILNLKVKKPNLLEQQKIAAVLSSFDKEIEHLQHHKTALIQQKQGLMQQLLSGEKRVKI